MTSSLHRTLRAIEGVDVTEDVPLAPLTTLQVGGRARCLLRAAGPTALVAALRHLQAARCETLVLGGGSNVLIADAGIDGAVLQYDDRRFATSPVGDNRVRVEAAAGLAWDDLVDRCIDANLRGVECLAGIPGRVGATPIQNVGAYGQEVSQTLEAVHVVDHATGRAARLDAAACGFAYRDSAFKGAWRGRFVITGVDFVLARGAAAPRPSYGELTHLLGAGEADVPLVTLQAAVLQLRRGKSMVYDVADPNHRSAGSFFTNPIVDTATAARLAQRDATMPIFVVDAGHKKLSAAWLIEHAGFTRGYVDGAVGLSTHHALAIINRGGAQAADVVALARRIRDAVAARFGVTLRVEPSLVGFEAEVTRGLTG